MVFGAAALLLTVVGFWARVSWDVASRGREWAIRQAVGAQPHEVVLAAVTEVVAVVGAGAIAGWSLFPVSAALVRTTIAGLPEADPSTVAPSRRCVRGLCARQRVPAGPQGRADRSCGDAASRVAPSARRYRPSKSSVARRFGRCLSARTAPCCRAGPPWDGTCVDRKSRGWRPIPDRLNARLHAASTLSPELHSPRPPSVWAARTPSGPRRRLGANGAGFSVPRSERRFQFR